MEHSFPPSCSMSNEGDDTVASHSSASQYLSLSTKNIYSPSQAMTDFADGSDALFSMYNEVAAVRDQKLAENWREDANALMLLSGLISATVGGFLSASYISSQTSSQDVSAFYLSQLYQLQANSSGIPSQLAPPIPASPPRATHMLWFSSLVASLSTAVFATLIQEWVRRYQVMTQPLYSPHKNARIRAFLTQQGSLVTLQQTIEFLHTILHQSIFFFCIGLITLTAGDGYVIGAVITWTILSVILYLKFSLTPYFRPHSFFSTPLSGFFFTLQKLPLLSRALFNIITHHGSAGGRASAPVEVGWLTWSYAVKEIEKLTETNSTLDSWALSSLLTSLSREQEVEQFLASIPNFYRSSRVENPAEVLRELNTGDIPKAIVGFMDHSLSSSLVSDAERQKRIAISLRAIQVDSYLLQRTFYHALGFMESAVFTCIDFVLLADQHTKDDDPEVRFLARCITAVAINRLGGSHTDGRWAGIVRRGLDWPGSTLAEYRERSDSIKLRNLIQLAHELNATHPDSNDPSTRAILDHTLSATRQLKAESAALEMQHEFCDLWNSLLTSMHDRRRPPVVRSNVMFIVSFIRPVYFSLHQGTDFNSVPLTDDLDPTLQNISSYPLCTVSSHRLSTLTNPEI